MTGRPAARLTDFHICPMVNPGPVPHVGGPILPTCSTNILIGNLPAARITDKALCTGPVDVIVQGSPTVLFNNLLASRIGDRTAHGGVIIQGQMNVLIGDRGGGPGFKMSKPCLKKAAAAGSPFVKAGTPGAGTTEAGQSGGLGDIAPVQPSADAQFQSAVGKSLSDITGGLEVADVQKLYKASASKDVSTETLITLFSDPQKSNELLMEDPTLHRNLRDILNNNPSISNEQDAVDAGYKKMSRIGSIFHNQGNDERGFPRRGGFNPLADTNTKYVSPDGHREVVFSGNGSVVSDNLNKGTFNFFEPADGVVSVITDSDQREKYRAHDLADIQPYKKWGN